MYKIYREGVGDRNRSPGQTPLLDLNRFDLITKAKVVKKYKEGSMSSIIFTLTKKG